MTKEEKKELLKAQQGELDAVLMYQKLADACADPLDRETFKEIAMDEGKHASLLRKITGKNLKPRKGQAVLVSSLYRMLGRRKLYPKIVQGEYDAGKSYEPLIRQYPQIESIAEDEQRHGERIKGLLG